MAKFNRRPRRELHVDPDHDWNKPELTAEEGVKICTRILQKLEDAPSSVWDKAFDFFNSVEEKVKSICETIERSNRFSDKQKTALLNMEGGIDRWLERHHD